MTAKRIISLVLALLLTLPLAACGKTVSYRDDVSVDELSAAVQALIPVEGGYDMSGEDFLKYYFDFDHRHTIDGFAIASSSASTDVNEYGIIHLSDPEQVAQIEEMAQVYVENQRDFLSTFLNTYNEAEMAKLEEMQVRVFGNYVVYTILSANDTAAVMNAIEAKLTKQ